MSSPKSMSGKTEILFWAKHLKAKVQPITIVSKKFLHFPLDVSGLTDNDSVLRMKKSILQYIKKAGGGDFLPPEIIFVKSTSTRQKAAELAKLAEAKDVAMIFTNTRATVNRNPFRVGGFAEILASVSRVPVLLLNPGAASAAKIPSILFPTDFSRDSRNALLRLEPWARAFQARIVLFNQVEGPLHYGSEFSAYGLPGAGSWEVLLKDVETGRKRHARAWLKALESKGIDCVSLVERQKNSTSSDILAAAKKYKVSMITLATKSGPLARIFLGSTARDVLLRANLPVVLCYRPKTKRNMLATKASIDSAATVKTLVSKKTPKTNRDQLSL